MSTFNDYLFEAFRGGSYGKHGGVGNPHSILPASRVLFNKNKVTPDHAHSEKSGVWHQGKQHVQTYVHHEDKWGKDGRTTVTKHFHVAGSGHYDPKSEHDPKVGEKRHFQHDQTMRQMHPGHLVGVSNYTDGKKVEHHGEDHSKTAAPLHVFK